MKIAGMATTAPTPTLSPRERAGVRACPDLRRRREEGGQMPNAPAQQDRMPHAAIGPGSGEIGERVLKRDRHSCYDGTACGVSRRRGNAAVLRNRAGGPNGEQARQPFGGRLQDQVGSVNNPDSAPVCLHRVARCAKLAIEHTPRPECRCRAGQRNSARQRRGGALRPSTRGSRSGLWGSRARDPSVAGCPRDALHSEIGGRSVEPAGGRQENQRRCRT